MFARNLHLPSKPYSAEELSTEKGITPFLREDFRDEILFVTPGETDIVGISLWDEKENAQAGNRVGKSG